MPLDGIVVHSLINEFNDKILNGKIDKIYQPEKDELHLIIRNKGKNFRILLSAASNNPRVHITDFTKSNPNIPPMFCMVLRKHLTGGNIVSIKQPDFERIIKLGIQTYNELGDLTIKYLIIEIMGRHSNIILIDSQNKIIDSIKHVDASVSRIRQVLPGLKYVLPPSQGKLNPLICSKNDILNALNSLNEGTKCSKGLVSSFTGISPLIAREICYRALNDENKYIGELASKEKNIVADNMLKLFNNIKNEAATPVLIHDSKNNKTVDFSAVKIDQYSNYVIEENSSISSTMDLFYTKRDKQQRLSQKSADLLKLIVSNLERCKKKLSIQQNELSNAINRDKFKLYGDLITANMYRIKQGMQNAELENYYENNKPISVPLKPNLSPAQNAQKYYKKYTKAKNAEKMVKEQIKLNVKEIEYLETIHDCIERIQDYEDILEIRQELEEQGYVKKKLSKNNKKKQKHSLSKPLHFVSCDNFDIYIGKNNKQNDYLTLKFAKKDDIWFHVKEIPGSHTIIKNSSKKEIPDSTLLEAAILAAYHSKAKMSSKVAVDYTNIKNVSKPSGAKPGMVIYVNYKTLYVTPDESVVTRCRNEK